MTMMSYVDARPTWGYNKLMQTNTTERVNLLHSIPLFRGLSRDSAVLRRLAEEAHLHRFQEGEVIFWQGERGSNCHIVLQGRVRILVTGEDGNELAVRILGPGEIVGEMALFENRPRSATVEALEETQTLELHRDVLIHCLRRSPELALCLLRAMSARLRYATEGAEELASLPVPERLMSKLHKLAEWSGVPVADGVRIVPPMTQRELAALVGTSRESINRALVRLRRRGKVRLEEGWIVLLDEAE